MRKLSLLVLIVTTGWAANAGAVTVCDSDVSYNPALAHSLVGIWQGDFLGVMTSNNSNFRRCYGLVIERVEGDRVKVTRVWGRSARFLSFGLEFGAAVASFEATLVGNVLKFGNQPQIFRIDSSSMQGHYRDKSSEGDITLHKKQ